MEIIKKTYTKNNNEIVLASLADPTEDDKNGIERLKTILIIGVFHGEEPQGKFLIDNFLKSPSIGKNKLLFIPCLNPDGMATNTRQNANKVDLNRNFPTSNWAKTEQTEYFGGETPASEIETQFVIDIIKEFSPDIILTLHAPFKIVNYDGPAQKIAEKISGIINYPVQNDIGYPTPGSFGTYAGVERNIPTITLEFDEEIDVKELITPFNKIIEYLANI